MTRLNVRISLKFSAAELTNDVNNFDKYKFNYKMNDIFEISASKLVCTVAFTIFKQLEFI